MESPNTSALHKSTRCRLIIDFFYWRQLSFLWIVIRVVGVQRPDVHMNFTFLLRKLWNENHHNLPSGKISTRFYLLYLRGLWNAAEVCWEVDLMAHCLTKWTRWGLFSFGCVGDGDAYYWRTKRWQTPSVARASTLDVNGREVRGGWSNSGWQQRVRLFPGVWRISNKKWGP